MITRTTLPHVLALLGAFGATAGLGSEANANIHLELRAEETAEVGNVVEVGLYAVSDDASEQSFFSMEVILDWDPSVLRMLGNVNDGDASLVSSGFPTEVHGLNESFPPQDGDALYVGITNGMGMATPEGTLVTTFQFEALRDESSTIVDIVDIAGSPAGWTVVWDATVPGLWVTGELSGAELAVQGGPFGACPGDTDGNGAVDVLDMLNLLSHWKQPGSPYDQDGDDMIGVLDILAMLAAWGPCPA